MNEEKKLLTGQETSRELTDEEAAQTAGGFMPTHCKCWCDHCGWEAQLPVIHAVPLARWEHKKASPDCPYSPIIG